DRSRLAKLQCALRWGGPMQVTEVELRVDGDGTAARNALLRDGRGLDEDSRIRRFPGIEDFHWYNVALGSAYASDSHQGRYIGGRHARTPSHARRSVGDTAADLGGGGKISGGRARKGP